MSTRARLAASAIFAIMMSVFEAAVVVYLRRLWELGEIDVARASLSNPLIFTEVLRELASLGMIASAAFLAGRRGIERLGHAAVIFGIWDILYYGLLRAFSGWPKSLLDWDVLFLIPRPWVAPVLAPLLVSAALVGGGIFIVVREGGGRRVSAGWGVWLASVLGGAIVIVSFLMPEVPRSATDVLSGFSWGIFGAGLGLALAGFGAAIRSSGRRTSVADKADRCKADAEVEMTGKDIQMARLIRDHDVRER